MLRNDSTYIQVGKELMILDADGRFRQWFNGNLLIKRGLNHEFLLKEIKRENNQRLIERRRLSTKEIEKWTHHFSEMIHNVLHEETTEWLNLKTAPLSHELEKAALVEKLSHWSFEKLQEVGDDFASIYKPISILPPDQYQAVVLQISEGCSYNKCTFCNFYRDRPFRIKGLEETREHVQQVKIFFGEDIYRRKTIFLGDANAIIIPQKRLIQLLEIIESEFSFDETREQVMEGIYAFMDVFGLQWKTVDELKEIHDHHVKTIYIGLETGDPELRNFIGKQGEVPDVIEQIKRVKAAGINVGVIVMVGVGGTAFQESHRVKTIQLLQQLGLGKKDMVFLSPFVAHKDLPYVQDMANAGFEAMTTEAIDEEMTRFRDTLKETTEAKISNYYIDEFIY